MSENPNKKYCDQFADGLHICNDVTQEEKQNFSEKCQTFFGPLGKRNDDYQWVMSMGGLVTAVEYGRQGFSKGRCELWG